MEAAYVLCTGYDRAPGTAIPYTTSLPLARAIEDDVLGRRSTLAAMKQQLGSLPVDERKRLGKALNDAKASVETAIAETNAIRTHRRSTRDVVHPADDSRRKGDGAALPLAAGRAYNGHRGPSVVLGTVLGERRR